MKKILLILLLFSGACYSQTWKQYYDVPTKNTQFGVAIPYGQIVLIRDSTAFYKITHLMNKTDSMATVFRSGWFIKVGSGDSYWDKISGLLRAKDTTDRVVMKNGTFIYPGNGDANCSGTISGLDALIIKLYIAGKYNLTDLGKANADVNGDGKISYGDAAIIEGRVVTGDPIYDADSCRYYFGTTLYQYQPGKVKLTNQHPYFAYTSYPFAVEAGGSLRIPLDEGLYFGGLTESTSTDSVTKISKISPGVLSLDGKLGIGTTVIPEWLTVNGKTKTTDLQITNPVFTAGDYSITVTDNGTIPSASSSSQWIDNGSDIYFSAGKVGVGLSNPSEKFTVYGKSRFQSVSEDPEQFVIHNGDENVFEYDNNYKQILMTGKTGIGTTMVTLGVALDVNGVTKTTDLQITNPVFTAGAYSITVTDNGTIPSASMSMVYPGAGIAVSTGTAWGTSIVDNSTAWNAAVPSTRTISTTSPLMGGGDLSANRTFYMNQSGSTSAGYLSSTDWNTFNNKGSGTITAVTGSAPVVSSGGTTPQISMAAANGSTNGYLSSTDWTTFNGKVSSQWTTSGNDIYYSIGIVGVGVTNMQDNSSYKFQVNGGTGTGVYGTANVAGVRGYSSQMYGVLGEGSDAGVYGTTSQPGSYGVVGIGSTGNAHGVKAVSNDAGIGLYASSVNGYAAIFANGKVGIGTTLPTVSLDISTSTGDLQIKRTSTSAPTLSFANNSYSGRSLGMYAGHFGFLNGNVGIGTTTPAAVLDINGSVQALSSGRFYTNAVSLSGAINGIYTSNTDLTFQAARDASTIGSMLFNTNDNGSTGGTERMRITPTGNVGIGTSAPAFKLDVTDTTRILNENISSGKSYSSTTSNGFTMFGYGNPALIATRRINGTRLTPTKVVANDILFTLNSGGYSTSVVFGKAKLLFTSPEDWSATSTPTYMSFFTCPSGSVTAPERLRIDMAGNVGVGTTNSTIVSKFQVSQPTTGIGTVTITGNTTCTGTRTMFTNDFKIGDNIIITATSETRAISAIASNTVMTIASATNTTGSAYTLAGGDRMALFGNGRLGIGTTALASGAFMHVKSAEESTLYGENTGSGNGLSGYTQTGKGVSGIAAVSGYGGYFSGTYGVYASSTAVSGVGVYGVGTVYGVQGVAGGSTSTGVYGTAERGYAVYGNSSSDGTGGTFISSSGMAVYANTTSGYSGVFLGGNVGVGTSAPTAKLNVKTGYIQVSSTTAGDSASLSIAKGVRYYGSATVWDDLQFPATQLKSVGVNNKPDFSTTELTYLFPQNDTTENVGQVLQMPHCWMEGSSIYPHIHWIQASATMATWRIKYRVYNIGGTIPAWQIVTSNGSGFTYVSGTIHQIAAFPAITMSGKTMSCLIDMIIYRTDNTLSGDALMKQMDIHFERDSDGSSSEYTK